MIHLDFETRSACNIFETGAVVYAAHPTTEILCLAYAIDEGPVKIFTRDDFLMHKNLGWPDDDLLTAIQEGQLLCAHNALFEESIWEHIMVKQYGWPRVPIKQWRCTAAKAAAHSLPRSLKDCGAALAVTHQKNSAGYRMMMKLCKPKADGTYYEDPEDFEVLYNYCKDDVESEREIDNELPDLIPSEQNIWFLDQLINRRGVYVDQDAIGAAIRLAEHYATSVKSIVETVSIGELDGVSRRMAVLEWCRARGVTINGYTKGDVNAVLESPDLPDEVRTVLEAKLQLGRTSVQKYQAMRAATADDGRIKDLLVYQGGTPTGRWAGKIVQLQNMPKGNIKDTDTAIDLLMSSTPDEFELFYPDVMGTLSSCIRGMIVAAPGNKLMVADYAAIEARGVMWLAGEEYGLKQFREFDAGRGEEPYILMAKDIYSVEHISKKGPERQLGKTTILGCGFGMGPDKFLATCTNWGIPVSKPLAEKAVGTYRSIYSNVPRSWYAQEAAAIEAVTNRTRVNRGRVSWFVCDKALHCRLPSGRDLIYNMPTLEYVNTPWGERKLALHYMAVDGKTKQWKKEHTYGGKIVENQTQGVARDILANALFNCEKKGYQIAFHVHDEVVSEVAGTFGTLDEFENILCDTPGWAKGLPIVAKGFITNRYRKD